MVDQIIKKMTREVENCPESSFFGTGIILDVGVKRYFTPSDTELLRALHFRNTKNIRNPLIFLQKMASYSYAEAFRPVQSDSQTSEWYRYFENDVLVSHIIL